MKRTTVALFLSLLGCASDPGRRTTSYVYATDRDPVSGQPVNIGQVDMRPGETFSGSYHSPQLGDLYLDQVNNVVTGTYEYDRAACHATGRIEGRTAGNLLRFTWTESQAACGRLQPLTGHGYFLFWEEHTQDGATNVRLNGDWNFGEREMGGGGWSAFRDRARRQPSARPAAASPGVFQSGSTAAP